MVLASRRVILSMIVGSAVQWAVAPAIAEPPALVLAVHPYLPPTEIAVRFGPLADEIAQALGCKVSIRVGATYAEHIKEVGTDQVDIAYLAPASYVKLVATYGLKPILARQVVNGDPFLRGEIFVRRDSPFKTLADLKGAKIALGDPESTMSILPLKMLRRAGVAGPTLGRVTFMEGQPNVALAVLAGDYDAGATRDDIFQQYAKLGLRSIARTPAVDAHLFVTRATMPKDVVDKLRRLLLELKNTPRGRSVMTSIQPGMTALVAAKDSDYDSLRTLVSAK